MAMCFNLSSKRRDASPDDFSAVHHPGMDFPNRPQYTSPVKKVLWFHILGIRHVYTGKMGYNCIGGFPSRVIRGKAETWFSSLLKLMRKSFFRCLCGFGRL